MFIIQIDDKDGATIECYACQTEADVGKLVLNKLRDIAKMSVISTKEGVTQISSFTYEG